VPYNEYGNKSAGGLLKWVLIVVVVLALAYLAFFFFVGKAVVGTVTG
jgi:flagellar basal body-associated protein FliL